MNSCAREHTSTAFQYKYWELDVDVELPLVKSVASACYLDTWLESRGCHAAVQDRL